MGWLKPTPLGSGTRGSDNFCHSYQFFGNFHIEPITFNPTNIQVNGWRITIKFDMELKPTKLNWKSQLYNYQTHLKQLSLIFSSIRISLILSEFSHFECYFFCVFSLVCLNILILTILILWICSFLTNQQLVPKSMVL